MNHHQNNKTIITVAITGSQGSKKLNPNTPVTNDEMIEDAYQCYLHGASIVHIHVKADDQETYEINTNSISYIIEELAKKCDIIVNVSTSGEDFTYQGLTIKGELDSIQKKRINILDLKPEMASYDIPTMNIGEKIFMNPVPFLRQAGQKMQELSILPEIEIFNLSDIHQAEQLIRQGYLSEKANFQLCLGIEGGIPASVKNLVILHDALPKGVNWSAFGISRMHLPIMYTTLAFGGNIRVGLEDNLYYSYGQLTTNVELVKRSARVIKEYGNSVATPAEARDILGVYSK
ncbi:BKACE family enzyme [Fundicoccus culcitae]|uniref:3-keto-5-aminohexanoate cleavage protein n=1 Tax=Fundicoccus culcitae TaxID=2969821 RepID=A0ABY5P8K9_9LACT|nr:3-keto-5-aminohexanoate cleavage protein [Fundicoccus culcitae]UUX35096.1 3-keto-5-aminohexanoate cleavage protein [Fundicoccus culcitae]